MLLTRRCPSLLHPCFQSPASVRLQSKPSSHCPLSFAPFPRVPTATYQRTVACSLLMTLRLFQAFSSTPLAGSFARLSLVGNLIDSPRLYTTTQDKPFWVIKVATNDAPGPLGADGCESNMSCHGVIVSELMRSCFHRSSSCKDNNNVQYSVLLPACGQVIHQRDSQRVSCH